MIRGNRIWYRQIITERTRAVFVQILTLQNGGGRLYQELVADYTKTRDYDLPQSAEVASLFHAICIFSIQSDTMSSVSQHNELPRDALISISLGIVGHQILV